MDMQPFNAEVKPFLELLYFIIDDDIIRVNIVFAWDGFHGEVDYSASLELP
jgi:hypothetical protein